MSQHCFEVWTLLTVILNSNITFVFVVIVSSNVSAQLSQHYSVVTALSYYDIRLCHESTALLSLHCFFFHNSYTVKALLLSDIRHDSAVLPTVILLNVVAPVCHVH